jgi:hypothetical protein
MFTQTLFLVNTFYAIRVGLIIALLINNGRSKGNVTAAIFYEFVLREWEHIALTTSNIRQIISQ